MRPDARKIMFDFVVFHGPLFGENFSQQHAKLRNIPLTVSQVIQELALGMVGLDLEFQIERLARSNDTKILIENDQRLSNRIHDGVRKYPSVLDVNELFSEHVKTLAGAGVTGLSVPGAPNRCRR